jgi:hypothetical protein
MAIVRKFIRFDTPLTPEQIQELEEMDKAPIVYDEDCPKRSYEELKALYDNSKEWREERKRRRMMQTRQPLPFSVDVLPATVRAAEKYGADVMGRLLDLAVNDKDLLQKCL